MSKLRCDRCREPIDVSVFLKDPEFREKTRRALRELEEGRGIPLSACDCIIPAHWPKNYPWAHRDGCSKKAALIEAEKRA